MLVTISVSFTWEIDPLRMAELVAHEIKVALTTERLRYETDHLVESHASRYLWRLIGQYRHVGVDLRIKKPHGNGLVTYNGLIVTLGIADDLLLPSPVGQTVCDVTHVPIVVGRLH